MSDMEKNQGQDCCQELRERHEKKGESLHFQGRGAMRLSMLS